MKITNGNIELNRTHLTKQVDNAGSSARKQDATQPAAAVQRSDSVQISDAGRALATQRAEGARGELSAEQIGEFRQKILQGAYNSVEVVSEVAQRMLQRGDI